MNDLIVRELMNGIWFFLSLLMVFTFAGYLIERIRTDGDWYILPGSQAALALLVFLGGSTIRAGWIWWMLHCMNTGLECAGHQNSWWLLIVATALVLVGGLCCMRVFAPMKWRPWSWIIGGVVSVAIPLLVYAAS